MLIIVFLFNLVIQVFFTTFMPIATPASEYYGVDFTAINWLALIWCVRWLSVYDSAGRRHACALCSSNSNKLYGTL